MTPRKREFLATGASFAFGALVGGTAFSAIEVFYFGHLDPKFSTVPLLAFEVELASAFLLAVVGSVGFAIATLAWRQASQLGPAGRGKKLAFVAVAGSLYLPVLTLVVKLTEHWLPPEALGRTVVAALIVVAYPVLLGILMARRWEARQNRSRGRRSL